MVRFLFRALATFCLAVAVILAVLDATRSVAMSSLMLTPLGESFSAAAPQALQALENAARDHAGPLGASALAWLLAQPGAAVFVIAAFLLYAAGHRRASRSDRLAARWR